MRTYRLLLWLALVAIMLMIGFAGGLQWPVRAATPALALIAPAGSLSPTGSIDIDLRITDISELGAFEFELVYDPVMLQFTGFTPSSFLGQTTGCSPTTARCAVVLGPRDQGSRVALGAYTYGTGVGATGDATLGVLHLRPTGRGGTTTLQLANVRLTDVAANLLQPATRDATVVFQTQLFLPLIQR